MCCAGTEFSRNQINGECEHCGAETVDGEAYDACSYSTVECEECSYAPCDQSC